MTDSDPRSGREKTATTADESNVTDGRYVYCLVDTESVPQPALSVTGLEGAETTVVSVDDVGAVIHECEAIYDTSDVEQVKRWLVAHQQVVDEASDVFGTPLPMRFDTILDGGEDGVERWIGEKYETIRDELTAFAGLWEYRIHLLWDASTFERRATEQDERLRELARRQDRAEMGTGFLLDKQREQRLRDLKRKRRAELTRDLKETVSPVVERLRKQDAQSALGATGNDTDTEREQIARLAVLASDEREEALGERLDTVVEQDAVQIRFTGPWPPYTFAPEIG